MYDWDIKIDPENVDVAEQENASSGCFHPRWSVCTCLLKLQRRRQLSIAAASITRLMIIVEELNGTASFIFQWFQHDLTIIRSWISGNRRWGLYVAQLTYYELYHAHWICSRVYRRTVLHVQRSVPSPSRRLPAVPIRRRSWAIQHLIDNFRSLWSNISLSSDDRIGRRDSSSNKPGVHIPLKPMPPKGGVAPVDDVDLEMQPLRKIDKHNVLVERYRKQLNMKWGQMWNSQLTTAKWSSTIIRITPKRSLAYSDSDFKPNTHSRICVTWNISSE